MKRKCPFCGEGISAEEEFCPNCGTRLATGEISAAEPEEPRVYEKPRTIGQLRAFCAEKGMPLERMRFFIGEDVKEPRAFGLFRAEDGDFVVYKNKSDGTRAVRYRGPDEAFAVNEIYEKLKSETELRRGTAPDMRAEPAGRRQTQPAAVLIPLAVLLLTMLVMLAFIVVRGGSRGGGFRRGYYGTGDADYYYNGGDWFYFSPDDDAWYDYEDGPDAPFAGDPGEWFLSRGYDESYGVTDFADSEYDPVYDDYDDYDWDSGSDGWDDWDSGGTDWDSDW